jgi:hypothetical protein
MADTAPFWAYGSQLQLGDGLGAFTTVSEVKDFNTPKATRDRIDTTSHSSPGGYRRKLPTLKDGGDVTYNVNWLPTEATHNNTTGLTSLYDSGEERPWKIIATDEDESEVTFNAFVMEFEGRLPVNGVGEGAVTLMPTGVITWP